MSGEDWRWPGDDWEPGDGGYDPGDSDDLARALQPKPVTPQAPWWRRSMRWLIGLFVAASLLGCGPVPGRTLDEEERTTALAYFRAWERYHAEEVPQACYEALDRVHIVRATTQEEFIELGGECGPEGELGPCPLAEGWQGTYGFFMPEIELIVLPDSQWWLTLGHEVVHLLEDCTGVGIDWEHENPYWGVFVS